MKMLINYWFNKQESKKIEIEVDEKATFKSAEKYLSQMLNQDVILLPLKIKEAINSQTLSEGNLKGTQNLIELLEKALPQDLKEALVVRFTNNAVEVESTYH